MFHQIPLEANANFNFPGHSLIAYSCLLVPRSIQVNQNLCKNADMIKDTQRRLSAEKAPLLSFEPVVDIANVESNDNYALLPEERPGSPFLERRSG